jgi:hypothetical protein
MLRWMVCSFLSLSVLIFDLYVAISSSLSIICIDLAQDVFVHLFLCRFAATCDPSLKVDIKYVLLLGHGLVTIKEDADTYIFNIFMVIRMPQH